MSTREFEYGGPDPNFPQLSSDEEDPENVQVNAIDLDQEQP